MTETETFISEFTRALIKCRDVQTSNVPDEIKKLARTELITKICSTKFEENWQCVETPYDIIGEMVDLVKCGEYFIVFFSMEILEVLIKEKGIDKNKIVFIADNDIESIVAENVYGVRCIVLNNKSKVNDKDFLSSVKTQIGEEFMKLGKVAVIGNPPYQMQSIAQQNMKGLGNKSQAKPLYHLFIQSIIENISPDYFTMIVPSRWMVGGMGLEPFRKIMMADKRMKKIFHFGGSFSVFPTVKIDGGVNYFLWQKDYSGECEFVHDNTTTKRFLNKYDIILQDNNAIGILDKILKVSSSYISDTCYSTDIFDLSSNFSDFKHVGIKCIYTGKKESYVDVSSFTDKNNIIGKWKVCIGKAFGESGTKSFRVFSDPFVIGPNQVCTQTYLVVNTFNNIKDANLFITYMKTKFFRFMLLQRKSTQNISKDKFLWVPDMGDYSTAWTDKELYNHFDLTRQEISYIESKIKAL